MTTETPTEEIINKTDAEILLDQLRELTYPYDHLGIRYRTFTLPRHMAVKDTETLLVKCIKGVNGNGCGRFEWYMGKIERVENGYQAVDTVDQVLGVFDDRWVARERLVELAAQIFPEWFGYRYDKSLDW